MNFSFRKAFFCLITFSGEIKDTMYQGIVSPLFMSTTYPWFGGDAESKPYPRYFNTPNQEFLSKKIASLENGEKALIFTSGGSSSLAPRRIVIGRVIKIVERTGTSGAVLEVRLSARLQSLNFVRVLLYQPVATAIP